MAEVACNGLVIMMVRILTGEENGGGNGTKRERLGQSWLNVARLGPATTPLHPLRSSEQ